MRNLAEVGLKIAAQLGECVPVLWVRICLSSCWWIFFLFYHWRPVALFRMLMSPWCISFRWSVNEWQEWWCLLFQVCTTFKSEMSPSNRTLYFETVLKNTLKCCIPLMLNNPATVWRSGERENTLVLPTLFSLRIDGNSENMRVLPIWGSDHADS